MGKRSYSGGHTVLGPGSGWFTKRTSLEDLSRERAARKAEAWQSLITHVTSQNEEELAELEVKKEKAERIQAARKAKVAAKRKAREERKLCAEKPRPSGKAVARLGRSNPKLLQDIKDLFEND